MEQRIIERENLTGTSLVYQIIDNSTDFRQKLVELGLFKIPTDKREMSEDLKAYYNKLQQIVNSL